MIRIVLADDHHVVREGLIQLLQAQADLQVVGDAADGRDALELCRRLQPDILLVDIAMPHLNGIETTRLVREAVPACQVLVLSMFQKEAYARQAFLAGARGYVLKAAPSAFLLAGIRRVAAGEYYLSPAMRSQVMESYVRGDGGQRQADQAYEQLSERERQVFHLLIEGNTSQQIADLLCVSPKTVEKHRANIVRKLGVSHPIDMVKYAVRIGVLDLDFWES